MKIENTGQNKEKWITQWKALSIESEIQMWDFYGLRPWIMKYVPRHGKVIEAGCGLGRYVFLLSRFGIDIEGIDFLSENINYLNNWKKENGFNVQFKVGDVTNLPYEDNSISGYLSFGVIEHFKEGPHEALVEAYRVLRPGGIAIITTPSKSWSQYLLSLRKKLRNIIKQLIGRKVEITPFFQYWYKPKQLKYFIEKAGFTVTRYGGTDFLYTFHEICKILKINLGNNKFLFKLAKKLDNSILRNWGAQSVVIAIKTDENMYCFFSGKKSATADSLKEFDVPISAEQFDNLLTSYYRKSLLNPVFHNDYQINPTFTCEEKICKYSNKLYKTDILFENYGLAENIHPDLLFEKGKNIYFSNTQLQPIWRYRNTKSRPFPPDSSFK